MVSHVLKAPHDSEGGEKQGCSLTPAHSLDTILLVVTNFTDERSEILCLLSNEKYLIYD
jgi:hypothetical protein